MRTVSDCLGKMEMKRFSAWLERYNNGDVEPFLDSLESMRVFYAHGVGNRHLQRCGVAAGGLDEIFPAEHA